MTQDQIRELSICGKPIPVGFFTVRSLTLDEIFDYGVNEYQKMLSTFFFDVGELDLGGKLEGVRNFILFTLILKEEKNLRNTLLSGLRVFTGLQFGCEEGIFTYEDKIIDEDTWEELRLVLAAQNKIKYEPKSLEYNPIGAKAIAMHKKILETRKQVQDIKSKNNETPALADLISGLCAKHPTMNLLNVWNFTYYQFLDQLEGIQVVEKYEFALRSVLAGADAKKMKIKHWTSKK